MDCRVLRVSGTALLPPDLLTWWCPGLQRKCGLQSLPASHLPSQQLGHLTVTHGFEIVTQQPLSEMDFLAQQFYFGSLS